MYTKDRNKTIQNFFYAVGFPGVRLIGKMDIPAIIFDNSTVLSCHVDGNMLHFTDKPKEGNIALSFDLELFAKNRYIEDPEGTKLHILILEHRKCYRIKLSDVSPHFESMADYFQDKDLYLNSYHYNKNTRVKFPIFLPGEECKLYFEKEQALDACSKINKNHPDLILDVI